MKEKQTYLCQPFMSTNTKIGRVCTILATKEDFLDSRSNPEVTEKLETVELPG